MRHNRRVSNVSVSQRNYWFSNVAVTFFGILVGAVLSVSAYLLWLYFVYQPRVADPETIVQPEDRLRPGQVGAVCIPICLFVFAWTSRERYAPNTFSKDYGEEC